MPDGFDYESLSDRSLILMLQFFRHAVRLARGASAVPIFPGTIPPETSSVRETGRRRPKAAAGMERLEPRTALTVSSPTIGWTPASNSGLKTDDITRVARPVFTGWSTPGTRVVVAEGATVIGVAKANPKGIWVLPTPLSRAFIADGRRNVTATAVNAAREVSSASGFSFMIDRSPPRLVPGATGLSYNSAAGITVRFSEKVLGMSLSKLQLRIPGNPSLPLNDARVTASTNGFKTTRPDDTTYAYKPVVLPYVPGKYTIALLKTGITDIAGNPLVVGRSYQFTPRFPGS